MSHTVEETKAKLKETIVDTERTMSKLQVEYGRLKDITNNLKADLRKLKKTKYGTV